ncbi:Ribosomal protein S12 methylthiotransferase RimO [uncultured Desulfobacterium sp.]|uniref:Ribosomal protein uS12 methylthiotransferase RimO n=1 Tax=uncultured Desulfobacterium sp. TaxID=201089 RepID=A0A445N238_9BACT|nr:Ribosomal protein S12 methylthiotransferase RimO [uncultured Desulfobacterium sp.]
MIEHTYNKVSIVSLGCAKNMVDSEHMLGILKSNGFDIVDDIYKADVAIINTCAFIRSAVEESIDTILEIAGLKKTGGLKKLIVAGCFVQRYGYKLRNEIPEVDGWVGTGEFLRIPDVITAERQEGLSPFHIGRPLLLADHRVPRLQSTPFFTAYMKIAEGCSHRCAYCIIPGLRGPLRSRTIESLVVEAEEMVARGVREINLIAQDTTQYGRDLEKNVCLEDLLERLVGVRGIRWIRLLYCHPEGISERLLDLIDSEEVICPYLDLPQQHVNKGILRTMGRVEEKETALELIARIRSKRRRISIRTTLMVGFPGETEKMFMELCEFVKQARIDHLGVFVYSPEKGTPAARLKADIDEKEAEERRSEILKIQSEISFELNRQMIGKTIPVMIEGPSKETDLLLTGRTAAIAPDVDGQVLINRGNGIIGEIMPVLITEAYPYDIIGEIVE